jgi:predicted transcriptional regulator
VVKRRILLLLKDGPVRNQDIRTLTGLDRQQTLLLMKELESEGLVYFRGRGSAAYWFLVKGDIA